MTTIAERGTGGGVPAIWGNVPQRNRNFTGRETLLERLRDQMSGDQDVTAVLQQALQGLGGVGKTQLAIEYAYRFSSSYDIVWWVSADQSVLLRSSLAALAPRLGLSVAPGRVEDALAAVLDALRRGEPYKRWLLIFDNADQPEAIRDLIPNGPGHVLVTSRNHRWKGVTETIEVDVFSRAESLDFLRKRVPDIDETAATQLADELGDLPIALEQAAALQVESGMSVGDYLDLLHDAGSRLLGENKPTDYPVPVAAAWSLSMAQVRKHMPLAMDLLRRCAYFGPEPIPRDLLTRGRYVLTSPFGEALRDPLTVSRGMRELGRYALARMDNSRGTIQVHRLIQRLVRDELTPDEANEMQHDVHLLLASVDPLDPDEPNTWSSYAELIVHVGPSDAARCTHPDVRRLIRHLARYLYNVGDYTNCMREIDFALKQWETDSGEDDADVLRLRNQKADVLWALGQYPEAYEIRKLNVEHEATVLGENHEETLQDLNGRGADLRARGEFAQALILDQDSLDRHRQVFGRDHTATFNAANNLAVDFALNGRYKEALRLDEQTYEERRDFYGRDDVPIVAFTLNSIARDYRQAGHHSEALERARVANNAFEDLVRQRILYPDHAWVLLQTRNYSIALRTVGEVHAALQLARTVYADYQRSRSSGPRHPDTLAAAVTLGNALRSAEQYQEAEELIEETVERYRAVLGDHPYTHACAVNLAIVRRYLGVQSSQPGLVDNARGLLEEAQAALTRLLGDQHHYTLTAANALATTCSASADIDRAYQLDAEVLPKFRDLLGDEHPHTLAAATNLAVDLRVLDRIGEADELLTATLEIYRRTLGSDHPETLAAETGTERIAVDFDPTPI
ncbi:FxSxx-COOH system tetratricopeptide repeat protein [Cryptosporangium aurantiacum]|uniref:NB-ARC domain-containing protein n=1 Tax=Cryptosporangium aurantiacum TaxID=134849 RepID=A0A1M7N9N4_9ACTN|nr:FxSxx-COOH system tetratricopeptide repeat protein [Cryptosporangium aurantiacum]SHM99795.1 NB-ARC domain-containing protein [Cryptosporangium aurantiacum]